MGKRLGGTLINLRYVVLALAISFFSAPGQETQVSQQCQFDPAFAQYDVALTMIRGRAIHALLPLSPRSLSRETNAPIQTS